MVKTVFEIFLRIRDERCVLQFEAELPCVPTVGQTFWSDCLEHSGDCEKIESVGWDLNTGKLHAFGGDVIYENGVDDLGDNGEDVVLSLEEFVSRYYQGWTISKNY